MPLPIRFSCAVAVLAAGWLSFCAVPPTALAEVVLLKSGAKVEGEILNPARSKDDLVEVVPVEGLKLTLAASQVKGVLVQTKVLKDYEAAVARMADTLDAHLAMASGAWKPASPSSESSTSARSSSTTPTTPWPEPPWDTSRSAADG